MEQIDPDVTYVQDDLTTAYKFNKYAFDKSYTIRKAPRATIGKEERFSSTFAGMFIRAEAASELQCRDSPGPCYSPSAANLPRSQTVNWGPKPTPDDVKRKFHDWATRDNPVGPAAYNPKSEKILRAAERCKFGKADRFNSFGGHQYRINNSPWTSDGPRGELIDMQKVRPRSAAYSFGGGKVRPATGDNEEVRSRPRTAFLTHSIRGGLARPATLECNIGPADYDTDLHAISRNLKTQGKNKFGSAPRFPRPGLVFVSAEHAKADGTVCSPGPKYSTNVNSIQFKPRQSLTSLHWCP